MKGFSQRNSKYSDVLRLGLVLILGLALACGAAATATPRPAATPAAKPAAPAVPQAVATPTAAPRPTPIPAAAVVTGKVTLMNAVWGNQLFDPRDASAEVARHGRLVHAFWVAGNEKLEHIPGVLKSWKLSDNGLTWTLTVREGVRFHNGKEATIEDALFTLKDSHVPEAFASKSAEMGRLTLKTEITGPNTIEVTHKRIFIAYIDVLSEQFPSSNYGALIPKAYMEQVGHEGYNKAPVGAGPFKVATFKHSEQMLLERFDDYYFQPKNGFPEDRRPKFKTLDLRLVPEAATRTAAVRAGEADMVESSLQAKQQIESGGGRLILAPEATYVMFFWNGCWQPQLACTNKKVRQAVNFAIDRELIMSRLYGEAGVAKGWDLVTPSSLGYSPDLAPFPLDVKKAQSLLAEAGYPGGKGFPKLEIHTWVAGELPLMPEMAQLVADMLRKNLGLEVEVKVGDPNAVKQAYQSRRVDGHLVIRPNETRWDGGSSMNGGYADFRSKSHKAEDPELKKAVDAALAVIDSALRQEAYNKMYRVVRDEHYDISIGYIHLPWGVGPRIATWTPWPMNSNPSAWWTITLK